jgi:hypothetical protein
VALSDDQKAMLRLLAQREQGYDDLASLMGLSVDEVRTRVKEALEELDREEATAPPPPPPEPPKAEPPRALKEPEPEKPAAAPKPAPAAASSARRQRPKPSLPADKRMRVIAGAAGALAIVLIFLLIAGVFSGGDGENDSSDSTTASSPTTTTAQSSRTTQAILSPTNGSDASGEALFGKIRNTAVLQVQAEGLEPSPPGDLYTVWLYRSPRIVLRIGAVRVADTGGIAAQFPLPTEVLGYVAGGGFDQIDVSLTSTADYNTEVALAKREQRLPAYTGESVLRGEITGRLVEAGKAAGN